ncbi:hypothetical protein [Natronoglomus mannanivorans]|uniref:Uncharacterized protein n=1 Tax=Natronoglomus mannanivorans TaxID=2979990 RepID=A0AAP3E348_9EURY|nr:hypothetical protein [Halobacteria archaeon AArc-xg1-1]
MDDSAINDEWLDAYTTEEDVNAKYHLLRREAKRLRQHAERPADMKFTDDPAFLDLVRACNERVDGTLLVFAANDFGWPVALRPTGTSKQLQADVRTELLAEKYKSSPELDEIRRTLLDADVRVHQALVVRHSGDEIDYHLPGGWKVDTNFLTVREALGLIDYITHGHQREAILY